jgi:hypothetical protein
MPCKGNHQSRSLGRGVHLDSGGGTERSCGSRKNRSAHPFVAQVVPVGHVWVMRIKRYDRGHIVELSDGKATYVVLHANLLEGSM